MAEQPTDNAKNTYQNFAERNIAGLVNAGVDVSVAQATVKRILDWTPAGEDPATYRPPHYGQPVTVGPEDVTEARAAWYSDDSIPAKYKRILDAVEDEPNG
tara:strand:+ start:1462 stop:1764 length:303 start_codon:yes stop_codon:yes gene_type:complete